MSVASATVDQVAWSDPRIHYLAELAGYADGFDTAIGKMARLWGRCTFLQTDTLPAFEIRAIFGAVGVEMLIDAGLAEAAPDGLTRIKGRVSNAGKDRHGWYQRLQPAGSSQSSRQSSAGKARAASARRDDRGRLLPASSQSSRLGPASPASPAKTPASGSGSDLPEDLSLSARADDEHEDSRSGASEDRIPIGLGLTERQKLTRHGWDGARLRHDLLRSAGVDRSAVPWTAIPTGTGATELPARVRELQEAGKTPAEIREVLDRVIDVADATARREGHLRWFTPARLWERDSFWKSAETSPEQAAAQRAPASSASRGTHHAAAEEPVRKIKRL